MGILDRILDRVLGPVLAQAAAAPAEKERGTTKIMRQPTIEWGTKWSVDSVTAALTAHEGGDFSRSALLVDAMGRDDRISGCLNTRLNAITGANGIDFTIVAPEGGREEYAKAVQKWWPEVVTDAAQKAIASDMIMMGLAIARVHWDTSAKQWLPKKIERWHLTHVRWDDSIDRFIVSHEGGQEIIEPGDPNWLVLTPGGDRSWMGGAVRALGLAYVMRQWDWRDWARFNERHGLPIILLREPPTQEPAQKEAFFAAVRRMGTTGILRLPFSQTHEDGFDAQMMEAKDRGFDSFDKFLTALNIAIAVLLLGQNLTTEVKGGSFAAASAHELVRGDYLVSDTENLASGERDGLIKPWGRFNIAGWDDAQAPWPFWNCDPPADLVQEGTKLKTFGEALSQFKTTKTPVDIEQLAEKFGVPLLDGAERPDFSQVEEPVVDPNADPAKAKPPAKEKARAQAKTMAPGYIEGQLYVDDVVDSARAGAGKGLKASLLDELLEVIRNAKPGEDGKPNYDAIRAAVIEKYRNAKSPEEVRDITRCALVMGDLAGTAAVRQDAT
jgi:phage gp29-like protein